MPTRPEGCERSLRLSSNASLHRWREISEQPALLRATLDTLLPRLDEIGSIAASRRHVIFFARGSSDNAAVYGRALLDLHGGRLSACATPPVATRYGARLDLSDFVVVAIGQSGRNTETVDWVKWGSWCRAKTVAITNDTKSPLACAADLSLAASTYTTQLIALAVLCSGMSGRLDDSALHGVADEVERLIEAARPQALHIAEELEGLDRIVVCADGLAVTAAYELARELHETCKVEALALSTDELQRGSSRIPGETAAMIVVGTNTRPEHTELATLVSIARGAGIRVVAIGGGPTLAVEPTLLMPGPDLPDWLAPIGLIITGQLLVGAMARRSACGPPE